MSPPAQKIHRAEFVAGATNVEQLPPPTGFEVAFAGRSNVGKSSVMNSLMQRKNLVRTSSTPGCTRQISFFEVATASDTLFTLVDLPGYGYAQRSKAERKDWATLIEDYLRGRATLGAVVILFDARRGPEQEELDLIQILREPARVSRRPLDLILIGTKLDKLPRSRREAALAQAAKGLPAPADGAAPGSGRQLLGFSTEIPETHAALWGRIQAAFRGPKAG